MLEGRDSVGSGRGSGCKVEEWVKGTKNGGDGK